MFGFLFAGPYNKDCSMFGPLVGSPCFGKLQFVEPASTRRHKWPGTALQTLLGSHQRRRGRQLWAPRVRLRIFTWVYDSVTYYLEGTLMLKASRHSRNVGILCHDAHACYEAETQQPTAYSRPTKWALASVPKHWTS